MHLQYFENVCQTNFLQKIRLCYRTVHIFHLRVNGTAKRDKQVYCVKSRQRHLFRVYLEYNRECISVSIEKLESLFLVLALHESTSVMIEFT